MKLEKFGLSGEIFAPTNSLIRMFHCLKNLSLWWKVYRIDKRLVNGGFDFIYSGEGEKLYKKSELIWKKIFKKYNN